jgi:hypothetical protein
MANRNLSKIVNLNQLKLGIEKYIVANIYKLFILINNNLIFNLYKLP